MGSFDVVLTMGAVVMKREPKVPPWKQAKINKEKEEKEQQEKLEKEGEVLLKD